MSTKDLTVLIGTCDSYSHLWKNFSILFDRYWRFDTRNIFIGETKEVPQYTKTRFDTITCGKNLSWGERMLQGIEVSSNRILFLLEDYYLRYQFSDSTMEKYLRDFDRVGMNRLQLCASGFTTIMYNHLIDYYQYTPDSNYLISMQPSIWRKSFLIDHLLPNYSPWDFEIKGSKLVKNTDHRVFVDLSISQSATAEDGTEIYFNAMRQGKEPAPNLDKFLMLENLEPITVPRDRRYE